jgi:hypothetical protein
VQHSLFSFAAALGVATLHTGITLWYRLPILVAAGAMKGDRKSAVEDGGEVELCLATEMTPQVMS